MTVAREEILGKVRRHTASHLSNQAAEYAAIRREYRSVGTLGKDQTVRLFEDRLRDYEATVYRSSSERIADTIAAALAGRGKKTLIIPENLPAEWLPKGFDFVHETSVTYRDLNASDGVITACAAAIAGTGTILIEHSAQRGRRSLTLIPDYHLCIVLADQIVETVPEGLRRIEHSRSPITTISGPSATSDIEMTRIKGVHGPRFLDVVVVQDDSGT